MRNNSGSKYVTFSLAQTRFGISVMKTREIVDYGKVTPVPEAPDFVKGVINLRGSVVPVIDLSRKFFNKESVRQETSSIVIVEPQIDGEEALMGLIVDAVKDVVEIKQEQMEESPKYGSKLRSDYVNSVAAIDDEFILILDIDKVLAQIDIQTDLIEKDNQIQPEDEQNTPETTEEPKKK